MKLPIYCAEIINNQSLVIEDFESENINKLLLLRSVEFTYFFTRNKFENGEINPQMKLKGTWYSDTNLTKLLFKKDAIELSVKPIPTYDTAFVFISERPQDTIFTIFKKISIRDETIECSDSLADYNGGPRQGEGIRNYPPLSDTGSYATI